MPHQSAPTPYTSLAFLTLVTGWKEEEEEEESWKWSALSSDSIPLCLTLCLSPRTHSQSPFRILALSLAANPKFRRRRNREPVSRPPHFPLSSSSSWQERWRINSPRCRRAFATSSPLSFSISLSLSTLSLSLRSLLIKSASFESVLSNVGRTESRIGFKKS